MMKGQFLLGVSSIKPGTMNSFAQRQRRKILPRLLFKQQSSKKCNSLNNDVNERKDPENKPSVETTKSNVILLEQIKICRALARANATTISKKRKRSPTAEEMAIRRQNLERIFDQRRLAICEEIEKTWFLKGASLEVHRHNLKCTYELRKRGLSFSPLNNVCV